METQKEPVIPYFVSGTPGTYETAPSHEVQLLGIGFVSSHTAQLLKIHSVNTFQVGTNTS